MKSLRIEDNAYCLWLSCRFNTEQVSRDDTLVFTFVCCCVKEAEGGQNDKQQVKGTVIRQNREAKRRPLRLLMYNLLSLVSRSKKSIK